MSAKSKKIAFGVAVFAFIVVVLVGIAPFILRAVYVVPERGVAYSQFVKEIPKSRGYEDYNYEFDGRNFKVVIIETPNWALPSGPAVYFFEDTGKLVDWTPDVFEAPSFEERWDWAGFRESKLRKK